MQTSLYHKTIVCSTTHIGYVFIKVNVVRMSNMMVKVKDMDCKQSNFEENKKNILEYITEERKTLH